MITTFTANTWEDFTNLCPEDSVRQEAIEALENGQVIYFPHLSFQLEEKEKALLTPDIVPAKKSKNISYNPNNQQLKALEETNPNLPALKTFMHRYAMFSESMIHQLFPHYKSSIIMARTSFRPVEIAGRQAPSYRKDDTRLHVDAFPSSPNQGRRLLRVFSNINPEGKPRVWRLGDSFESVVEYFKPQLKKTPAVYRHLLKHLKITKGFRTEYDTLMLMLHDTMKADLDYQKKVKQQSVDFAAGGSWIVYTDQASHAATSGQFCCEQTFMLPVEGMKNPAKSPLRVMEQIWNKKLA
jgi:hypothetical protein